VANTEYAYYSCSPQSRRPVTEGLPGERAGGRLAKCKYEFRPLSSSPQKFGLVGISRPAGRQGARRQCRQCKQLQLGQAAHVRLRSARRIQSTPFSRFGVLRRSFLVSCCTPYGMLVTVYIRPKGLLRPCRWTYKDDIAPLTLRPGSRVQTIALPRASLES